MTNCCNEFGTCTQGRDCPVRTGKVLPHQAAHARKVAAAHGVARIKSTRPVWMDGKANTVPAEAGNFKIEYLGPDDDGEPLSRDIRMELVRLLLVALIVVLALVLVVSLAVGYGTERFADALWSYLERLS